MKKILFIASVAVALVFTGFTNADWYKFSSSDGHFSINFPSKPEESSEKQTTKDGTPFEIHYVSYSPSDSEVYMVGYIDMNTFYPAEKSMKEILENSRDGATGSMETTNVNTITTNLDGEPYIEFTFTSAKFTGKDRIYIINKYQYSLITIFSLGQGISPDADKFIRSFRHSD